VRSSSKVAKRSSPITERSQCGLRTLQDRRGVARNRVGRVRRTHVGDGYSPACRSAADETWHILLVIVLPDPAKLPPVSIANRAPARTMSGSCWLARRRSTAVPTSRAPSLSITHSREAAVNSASALRPVGPRLPRQRPARALRAHARAIMSGKDSCASLSSAGSSVRALRQFPHPN